MEENPTNYSSGVNYLGELAGGSKRAEKPPQPAPHAASGEGPPQLLHKFL